MGSDFGHSIIIYVDSFAKFSSNVFYYDFIRCGHLFHESCLERTGTFTDTEDGRVYTCYLCNQTQYSSKSPTGARNIRVSTKNNNYRQYELFGN